MGFSPTVGAFYFFMHSSVDLRTRRFAHCADDFIAEDLMRHLLEYLHTQGGVLQSYWNRNVIV